MVDPASAMAGITAAFALLKEAVGLANNVDGMAMKQKLFDVQAKLGDIMISLNEQLAENNKLLTDLRKSQDALRGAEQKLNEKAERKFNKNVLWIRGNPNPICAICDGNHGKIIPLMRDGNEYLCRVCENRFWEPQPPPDWDIPPFDWRKGSS